ncbi:MAG: hypothetical protein KDK78_01125, partial [Chlamydiia bacterium]|nr:hypothetical protein [Chlamydiia bacterium]
MDLPALEAPQPRLPTFFERTEAKVNIFFKETLNAEVALSRAFEFADRLTRSPHRWARRQAHKVHVAALRCLFGI